MDTVMVLNFVAIKSDLLETAGYSSRSISISNILTLYARRDRLSSYGSTKNSTTSSVLYS